MGCGGSKSDDDVEATGVAVKKEKGLTKAQTEKKEEEARLAEEAKRVAEEEAAAKAKARIRGCYLCYTDIAQGTLQLVWSETAVEGALAQFTTAKTVPQHKFVTNQGRSDLIKGIGTGASSGKNTQKLLNGFAQFVKNAQQWEGALTQLSQLDARPVSVFLLSADPELSEANIVRLALGEYIDASALAQMQAVAVFNEPAGTDKMKAKYMEIKSFVSFVEKEGAASVMLAAQATKAPTLKGNTSADLMEKLAKKRELAAGTTIETSGAKTDTKFGIGNTVKTASMEDAAAQAMLNANAGGASKAAALKAHGAMMAAAAPASEAPANEKI